ncbi:MAG: DUF2905 domain-containing protein [Candidatus Brocadiia bacterium]
MSAVGKALIVLGGVFVLLGVLLAAGDRVPLLGKLPGDVRIERDGFTLYLPVTTCVLLSVVLTVVVNVVGRLFASGR